MTNIYPNILEAQDQGKKLLAILLDPDKIDWSKTGQLVSKINQSPATHLFIGGSIVVSDKMDRLVIFLKQNCALPILLFPGNPSQISGHADGILFLSLLSGRNPDFLIGHQVKAAPILKKMTLEIISTAYILIGTRNETAVANVSKTAPLDNPETILHTAQAGEMLGTKLIYLEAGSGAKHAVPLNIIKNVSENITIPLIVGGGIRNKRAIQNAYDSGANIVVIGTAFENDPNFFD